MKDNVLDSFEDLSGWTPIASGQARLEIAQDRGSRGDAMRLEFDFMGGGGFVVARKPCPLQLPESFAFELGIRGHGPGNILEFKLVDASGQNVWRYREEVFDLPEDWQRLRIKSSQIQFAWGPLGGGPPQDIAAIEIVVAAGPGGQGSVWIEDLRLEDTGYYLTPLVEASSALPGFDACHVCDPSPANGWRSASSGEPQRLTVDFQCVREYGGLVVRWDPERRPLAFDIRLSCDGSDWDCAYSTEAGVGAETYVYLPDASSRFVRLDLRQAMGDRGFGVVSIEVQPFDFSRSLNDFFGAVARRARPGLYPKYLLGRQTYWTPVGTGDDVTQALFNEEGLVEVDKGSFAIEPFLFMDGRLVTWAEAAPVQTLELDYLPIPSSVWHADDLTLATTAFATGPMGSSILFLRYRLANGSDRPRAASLLAAIRPFQVTPTWQHWHGFGGVAPIRELAYESGVLWVNGRKPVLPLSAPGGFGAAAFAQGSIGDYLDAGALPPAQRVEDGFGYASGALRFDLEIPPGAAREVYLAIPFGESDPDSERRLPTDLSGEDHFERALASWQERLDAWEIRVPPDAQALVETLKTAAAHILINRDGPALHPGPRRYSRSWIRDGALMGAALARVGIPQAGRDFVRWYAAFQTEGGDLPDCADRDGCEWLPEFDAWGELIFAVMDYYRFTRDRDFLAEQWPAVLKSVDYMESLRNRRLTAEYARPERQAYYGLLPESMSHEGYMAHPVHAYWDDFWALRGFKDAAEMAGILGEAGQQERIAALADSFQETLYASLSLTIRQRGLDFVPGSVEFADYDPAATAIAVSVADELHRLPRPAIDRTFEKYLEGFRARASGAAAWNNYSAYEIRIVAALVRLGWRREALELLDYFLADRRIRPWNQWPEISWHDPLGPSFIGDMPHSWIGAEYILAVRSLFAYERESDRSLVLAAGVAADWLSDGQEIQVRDLPTHYGNLSYSLRQETPDLFRVSLAGPLVLPPGGILLVPPLPAPLARVEIDGDASTTFGSDWALCERCPGEILLHIRRERRDSARTTPSVPPNDGETL